MVWSILPPSRPRLSHFIAHPFNHLYNRVEEIISGRSEAEKVLFRSPPEADPFGFLILPDMKWDLTTVASLYLVALTLLPNITNLRDLNRSHLPLLRAIRREATNVAKNRWGLERTELRLFIHYQPSYCKLCHPHPVPRTTLFDKHRSFSCPHRECESYQSLGDGGWSSAYARRRYFIGTNLLPRDLCFPFTVRLADS